MNRLIEGRREFSCILRECRAQKKKKSKKKTFNWNRRLFQQGNNDLIITKQTGTFLFDTGIISFSLVTEEEEENKEDAKFPITFLNYKIPCAIRKPMYKFSR